jgi:hypothetical protein
VIFNGHYVPGYKYLVLVKDVLRKNRFAVREELRNDEPYVHHLKDTQ